MTTSHGSHSFCIPFQAQWSDMDQNGHMRTHAFLPAAEDSRLQYFAGHGFPVQEFASRGAGPVIQADELRYHAELRLLDRADLDLRMAGLSADGTRFRMRNTFTRTDGTIACTVTSQEGWLDLRRRTLTQPPPDLLTLLTGLARTGDYDQLPSPPHRAR